MKKRVSFRRDVKCFYVLHLNDYTNDEMEASFLTPEDMTRIRQDIQCTIEKVQNDVSLDENKYCMRGLEYKTPEGARQRFHLKRTSRETVLREQELQYSRTGVCDQEILASIYRDCTHEARVSANIVGFSDRFIARHVLLDDTVYGGDRKVCNVLTNTTNGSRSLDFSSVIIQRQSHQRPFMSISA